MHIIYYQDEDGKCVVKEWIVKLEPKVQAKIYRDIDLLERFGLALGEPYIKKLTKDGIWELRTKLGSDIYRVLFGIEGDMIILHGFQKKTQKTPTREIQTALKRLKKFSKGGEVYE